MAYHAMLQVEADGHNDLGIISDFDDFFLQTADQNILVLRLIDGPMLGEDIFVAEKFFPQQSHLPKRIGDVQMNQIRLEKAFFDVVEAVLVHPQHLQFANRIDFWRTDINLHMCMVLPFYLLDLEGFGHILAIADGQDNRMTFFGQRVNHSDAEVAQGGVVGRGEPT